jgi:3-oxoisoapionate kinase
MLEHLLLSYYGDDFTGSTDVMEAFTAAGVPTVLFLEPPQAQDLERFAHMRCIGLAGQSRGKTPEWMQANLPAIFACLQNIGAPILHYKVCSTFDSAPHIGSIGAAIEIGLSTSQASWSPMVVGAPRLKRYQAFGQLFAAANDVVYRIDRHPTMSQHPVTPMREADLRLHLALQTTRPIELIDLSVLARGQGQETLETLQSTAQAVVMIDVVDDATQVEAGRLVWENRGSGLFSASSSGLQYALCAYWRSQGWLTPSHGLPPTSKSDCIAVVSGSCSPMSAAQLDWASNNGFLVERLELSRGLSASTRQQEVDRLVQLSVSALRQGQSPIVYSAKGPLDPAVSGFDQVAASAGHTRQAAAELVGQLLAQVMQGILDNSAVRRIVVAGGDSSGAVGSFLGIKALTVESALAPGVPLCRAWSDNPARDGLTIALKGGQLGSEQFYSQVLHGSVAHTRMTS